MSQILDEWEQLGYSGGTPIHRALSDAVREIRRLKHELSDPNYMYASGRIGRQALLVREAELDRYRRRVAELEQAMEKKP